MQSDILGKWDRKEKAYIYICLVIFMFGILIHLSLFTTQVTNPDGVMDGVVKPGHAWEFALGRWGIACIDALRSNVVLPSLTSIFSIFILSISAILIMKIFNVKSKIFCLIGGILLISFPTFAQTLTYYYCSDSYCLSLLISVVVVLIILRWDSWKAIPLAAILLMFSLSLYQSFIGVTIACSYLVLILEILNSAIPMKQIIRNASKLLLSGMGGLVLYFISFRICTVITGIPPADYRGISSLGNISLKMLPEMFLTAYKGFCSFYFAPRDVYNNQWWGLIPLYCLLFGLIVVFLLVCITQMSHSEYLAKWEKAQRIFLTIGAMAVAPLAFYTIVFLTPKTTIAYLMVPQMFLPFIFLLALVERADIKCKQIITALVIIITVVLQLKWIVMDNAIYSAMEVEYRQIYSQSIRLLDRIESYDDYTPGEQVAIIGYFGVPEYPRIYPELDMAVYGTIGSAGQIGQYP